MRSDVQVVLARIETDVSLLRRLIGEQPSSGMVPKLKNSYTLREAQAAKNRIEAAYLAGHLTYDAKRGMKRSVTVATSR